MFIFNNFLCSCLSLCLRVFMSHYFSLLCASLTSLIIFCLLAYIFVGVGVCVFVFVPVFLSYILRGKGFLWIQHEYIKLFERTRLFASLTSSSVCWSNCLYMCVCARLCLRLCVGKGSPRLFERPGLPLCSLAGEAFGKPMGLPYYSYSKHGSYKPKEHLRN